MPPLFMSKRPKRRVSALISDLDIYRAANLLIQQHDEDASIHAAMRRRARTHEKIKGITK